MVLFCREMMINMKKRFLSTLLIVVMTFSFLGTSSQVKATEGEKANITEISAKENTTSDEENSNLQLSEDGHPFGLKEMTPEIKAWADENIKEVKGAELNSFGKERVMEESLKKLAPSLTTNKVDLNEETTSVDSNASLPSQVDNSTLDAFPGIMNQEGIGCCASCASTYYEMSHMVNLMEGKNGKSDANRFSPKWTYNIINEGADCGSNLQTNYAAIKSIGAATLEDVPYLGSKSPKTNYLGWETDASIWKRAQRYSIKEVNSIGLGHIKDPKDSNLNAIKTELTNKFVLNYSTQWDACQWNHDNIQIKDDSSTSADDKYVGEKVCIGNNDNEAFGMAHALTLVGYNDDIWIDINGDGQISNGEKGAFKVANSWGTTFGNDGFLWVAYDAFNNKSEVPNSPIGESVRRSHGISSFMWIIPEIKPEEPKLYAKFTLNSSKRNQCIVKLTATDKKTRTKTSFSPYQFTGKGGQFGFDGTTNAVDGSFAIDLAKVVKDITPEKLQSYEWTLEVSESGISDSNYLILKDYRIVDDKNNKEYKSNIKFPIWLDNNSCEETVLNDYDDLVVNAVKTDKPEPRVVGNEINISADVSGGSKSKLYTYSIVSGDETKEVIKENTPEASVKWIPKDVGECNIKVDVVDTVTGEKATKTIYYSINNPLAINNVYVYDSPQSAGKMVALKVMAVGGNGQRTYTYKVTSPERYTIAENTTDSFGRWVPRKAGEYTIEVTAKDDEGNSVVKEVKFVATESLGEVAKVENLKLQPVDKDKVKITWSHTTTTVGTIAGYKIFCDGGLAGDAFANQENYTIFLDNNPHKYTVMAYNTDGTFSEVSSEVLVGRKALKFNSIKIDKPAGRIIGYPINISLDVEGGSGSRQYTYSVESYSGETQEVIKENTSESSITWIPKKSGKCFVKVDVKDTITGETATLKKDYDIHELLKMDDIVITENGKSSGPQGHNNSGVVGGKVSFNTVATGGDGNVTYSYEVIEPEKSTIVKNSLTSDVDWIPRKAGVYWIQVTIEDEMGNHAGGAIQYTATELGSVSTLTLKYDIESDMRKVILSWDIPTTTIGTISGYDIYCDGKLVNKIMNNSLEVEVDYQGDHEYKVMAFNSEGIYSEMSNAVRF
jgi:hypothetical protein